MAPLNPSEWVVPRIKKSADPPDRDLHVTHIHIPTLRRNMGLGQSQKRKIGVALPLQEFIQVSHFHSRSSQKLFRFSQKVIQFSDSIRIHPDLFRGLSIIQKT
jgi:hypothetical protein